MLPTYETFGAHHPAGLEIHLGLVVHPEVAIGNRGSHLPQQLQSAQVGSVIIGRGKHMRTARLFGLVHGGIGSSQQRRAVFTITGEHGNASTGTSLDGHVVHRDRRGETRGNGLRYARRRCRIGWLHQYRELVAAQTRHHRTIRKVCAETTSDGLQEVIAHCVTQRVIDFLKPIEIKQQHRETITGALGVFQADSHVVVEQRAIRQSCEVVIERLFAHCGLRLLLTGDVHQNAAHTQCLAVGVAFHADRVSHEDGVAITTDHAKVDDEVTLIGDPCPTAGLLAFAIIRVDVLGPSRDECRRIQTQQIARLGADEGSQESVGIALPHHCVQPSK